MTNTQNNVLSPNALSFIHIFRNKLNALFGDDPEFTIYEIDEPLPDGTIDYREGQHTLNIVCSNVAKLTIARDHIGEKMKDGEVLNIDYYYGRVGSNAYLNIKNRPAMNTSLDIAMLFEGNPHFSKFYTGWGQFGPWYCIAFKPELIQYFTDDAMSLHGRRSCAMEDIARDVFLKSEDEIIRFSTENIEKKQIFNANAFNNYTMSGVTANSSTILTTTPNTLQVTF